MRIPSNLVLFAGVAPVAFLLLASTAAAENNEAVMARVADDIRFLASDELEGRGPGTDGLEKAADFIVDRFMMLGLKGAGEDGSYLRPFEIVIDTLPVKEKTFLVLHGPQGRQLRLEMGTDFQPLAVGGEGGAQAEVVFGGYGITAPKLGYDDFQNVDVAGKVLVVIRREPQQDDSESQFDGTNVTSHSYIRTKVQVANKIKAAALLLVNDPHTTRKEKKDQLTDPGGFGKGPGGVPFAHVTQAVVNDMLEASPIEAEGRELTSVESLADEIDRAMTPMTQPLSGWTAELEFAFESAKDDVSNVIAILDGEGPLAEETVVIGAHYDHLGYGPFGSRRPAELAVHNGADDNATGTAAVLELARRFALRDKKPARRLVFIAFTAEERGIIGSNRYLEKPVYPLQNTVSMLNFDMIGNLREQGLLLGGVRTAKEFADLVGRAGEGGDLKVKATGSIGGSDHAGFYRKGVPVLFFFTGLTDVYHTPDDDYETINVNGVVQTIDYAERVLDEILALPERPQYERVARGQRGGGGGAMAYLGVVPDYGAEEGNGLRVTDVSADSPASRAGFEAGDVIIEMAGESVAGIQDLASSLRKHKAGERVGVVVRRGDDVKKLQVTLGEPRTSP